MLFTWIVHLYVNPECSALDTHSNKDISAYAWDWYINWMLHSENSLAR